MKKLLLLSFVIVSAATASAGTYAGGLQTHRDIASTNAATSEAFNLIHVADLQSMMDNSSQKLAIFDANSTDTRKTEGLIPGAKPLSSSSHYDVAKELPQDKSTTLVFYCANTACTASHAAASRAMNAGFKNVSVLADGIQGWKKSGKPVSSQLAP
jgi:rhodanese-related sulfurtransferase